MLKSGPQNERDLKCDHLTADVAVVGGGLAGACAAIAAARTGAKVVLIQDRPVLGGNASSEVRLWVLGATSHMGNNNRWAREGGVIDELLVENTYRNPEGNPLIVDTILLEKVVKEPNITLLLNTAVFEVTKSDADTVGAVRAFCSQNSTMYEVEAPVFIDASGDGIVGFMAGAAFRMGAEDADEFGEGFAPTNGYGDLLGHSLYFYTKDTGRPVKFTPPSYALQDIEAKVPRYRSFNTKEHGCQLWWIEHGGRLDTVHDTERIKWELWQVVYGVWDHIKNSGEFPEAESMTLEWVGTIPGKRESRRFEGDYMIHQRDLVEQTRFDDAVSYGGWAIDLHPADGVFSDRPGCTQWHSKGVYQVPYRCLYSRNINNLFLAGRIISASHVAFGSTRVMATCAHAGQAVGHAAAICAAEGKLPRDLSAGDDLRRLQRELIGRGQYIPHVHLEDEADLAQRATISASSELKLASLPPCRDQLALDDAWAMLVPLEAGRVPRFSVWADADEATELQVELRTSSRLGNFTPDRLLAQATVSLQAPADREPIDVTAAAPAMAMAAVKRAGTAAAHGGAPVANDVGLKDELVEIDFNSLIGEAQYACVCFKANPAVRLRLSDHRLTGVLALTQRGNDKVAKGRVQEPPAGIGIDTFAFWLPKRRPGGRNLAMTFDPPLAQTGGEQLTQGPSRPTTQPNAYIADPTDPNPAAVLTWREAQTIGRIVLDFDADFDHPMESVLMGHPERVMPFCVRGYRVLDDTGRTLAHVTDNHQTRNTIELPEPVTTKSLRIELAHPAPTTPAALFRVRCY